MRIVNNFNSFNNFNMNWWNNISGGNRNALVSGAGNNANGQNIANTSVAFRSSVLSIGNSANSMVQSLNNLRGTARNTTSPFQATRPVAEKADVLDVRSFDANRLRSLNMSNFSVDVLQVAESQKNEGAALAANARATSSGFSAGAHRIAVTVGDRTFDVNFNVSSTDTNRDVQQRIASAINNTSGIGVRASVTSDAAQGTSALVLQSAATGIAKEGQPNFTVRSVTGNAVSAAGISEITREAQDAEFRVNRGSTGTLQTSRSNDVDLGFGIMAQLKAAGSTGLTMGKDETAQINAFRNMVNSFNGMMQAARDAGSGSRMERELGGVARSFSSGLERIGITLNQDGFMRIDETRMNAAAASGELERFGTRDGVNFMSRLSRFAEGVVRNPVSFVGAGNSSADLMNSGINFSPSQMSMLSRLTGVGSLFDTMR